MQVFLQKADMRKELHPGALITLGDMVVQASGNTASVSADIDGVIAGTTASDFVLTINEEPSKWDGSFLIEGSGCVSWTYTDAVITNVNLNNNNPIHGALLFADMCPSCTTCENVYRLKHDLEDMKMSINTLKDVNLYTEDQAAIRHDGLESLRVTGTTSSCGIFPNSELQQKATQLFKEYVTMLHMWNYVVSINNNSAVIQLAPENTAGFVIQTKHAVTSCDKKIKLQCKIAVTKSGYYPSDANTPEEYSKMSVYIPQESLRFTYGPFEHTNDEQNPGFAPLAGVTPVAQTGASATNKVILSSEEPIEIQRAGTYMLEVKLLPFIPSVSTINGNIITPDNWRTINTDIDPTVTPVIGSTTYTYAYDIVTDIYANPISNPTRAQYMNSCVAPSSAVELSIIWNIEIVWSVWEEGASEPKPESQSYMYKCNAVSTPCSTYVSIGGSTIVVPDENPPEPEA